MKSMLHSLLPVFFLAAQAIAGDYVIDNASVIPMTEEAEVLAAQSQAAQ